MFLHKIETPESRQAAEIERLQTIADNERKAREKTEKINAEIKAEALRRESVWKERLLTHGVSSPEAVRFLQSAYSSEVVRDVQKETDMFDMIRGFGPGSDAKFANDLALSDYPRYKKLRDLAKAAGRVYDRTYNKRLETR